MDGAMLLRMLTGLLVVLGLLGLFAVALRAYGARFGLTVALINKKETSRLTIIETKMLDARHRLVLLGCDGREHLVILGGAQPVVVDSRSQKSET